MLKGFWSFGFSQFHRDWLNHRGAGAWKGCSSRMFSNSYLWKLSSEKREAIFQILIWKFSTGKMKTNVFKFISENSPPKTERLKSDVSNSYRYNLKMCNALIVKSKKHWLYSRREGGVHHKFISTFPPSLRWKNLITQKVTENWSGPIGWVELLGGLGNIGRNSSKPPNIITHAWSEERTRGRVGRDEKK